MLSPRGEGALVGILLTNLGTPAAPTPGALRRYLRQFLSDPRVVEMPRAIWLPILNGIILNTRPRRAARLYGRIWMPEGSPLAVYSARQATAFRRVIAEETGIPVAVAVGMRYGEPGIDEGLRELDAAGCERVLIFPLYPQYAAATTASTFDAVAACLGRSRNIPELRFLKHFHDHPAYIGALAERVRAFWAGQGRPERLLISFHGLPVRSVALGDPYHGECEKTARLLAAALELPEGRYGVSFQSRFGPVRWLEPYTDATLERWGREGVESVDVICPGFVSDCLETLEEIAERGKARFLAAGGGRFRYIPALNDDPRWIGAMAGIAREHLGGWLGRGERQGPIAVPPR